MPAILGRAILNSDTATAAVQARSVIYVPVGEDHAFAQITQDLTLLVIFAPACESRQR